MGSLLFSKVSCELSNFYTHLLQSWGVPAAAMFVIVLLATAAARPVSAQCLKSDDVQKIVQNLNSGASVAMNDKLREELLQMRTEAVTALRAPTRQPKENEKTIRGKKITSLQGDAPAVTTELDREKIKLRFGEILKTFGYPTQSLVGSDGASAGLYLLRNFMPLECQTELLPAVSAAVNIKELPQNVEYAAFVDRIKAGAGQKQIFGTQVLIKDGLFIVRPIEDEQQVDERRLEYAMRPLFADLKYLESNYKTATILERSGPTENEQPSNESGSQTLDGETSSNSDDDEVIRVQSDLVSLNVRVSHKAPSAKMPDLNASDFRVYENTSQEEITFFAKTDAPFDLVLLLDLSGSTVHKQDLIRKAAKRFIERARRTDRISIVTFTSVVIVLTPLTDDRPQLLASLKKIKDTGQSYVWDALHHVLGNSFGDRPAGRRRAVVMMSDGVDSTLTKLPRGSAISFAKLLETVRNDDTIVIPIYLDTDTKALYYTKRVHGISRRTIELLAAESGGQVYDAKKLEDLDGVYDRVLADLASVYSIGYLPSNELRPGTWRNVRVEIPGRPDMIPRTRQGYFVKR